MNKLKKIAAIKCEHDLLETIFRDIHANSDGTMDEKTCVLYLQVVSNFYKCMQVGLLRGLFAATGCQHPDHFEEAKSNFIAFFSESLINDAMEISEALDTGITREDR